MHASVPLLLALAINAGGLQSQATQLGVTLPPPSGPFAVGRTSLALTDPVRRDEATPAGRRRVMIYVWYPAAAIAKTHRAAYIPGFERIRRALGDSAMRAEFRSAYDVIRTGAIASPASDGPLPASTGARFPLLLFSHGFGESSLTYSTLLSDLASHGYVVVALEHPGDAYAVLYPDGQVLPFPQAQWDSALARPHGAAAYQLAQVPPMALDLMLVLGDLTANPPRRLRAILHSTDIDRVAVFGHSLGGLAAAETCRLAQQIRACANIDAEYRGVPWIEVSRGPPTQVFGFFATPHSLYVTPYSHPPSAETLTQEGLTTAQYDSIMQGLQQKQDAALASIPGGAYRVTFEGPAFAHRSFLDLDLLGAASDTVAQRHRANLILASGYLRAFFDLTLKRQSGTVLTESPPDSARVGTHSWPARN